MSRLGRLGRTKTLPLRAPAKDSMNSKGGLSPGELEIQSSLRKDLRSSSSNGSLCSTR